MLLIRSFGVLRIMKTKTTLAQSARRAFCCLTILPILLAIYGCSNPNGEALDYAWSLPNFCEYNQSHLFEIERNPRRYGKALEKSGWYGKWDTIYSQLCTHYLIWGDYEKSKKFGNIGFSRTPIDYYLSPDYFVADYLVTDSKDFIIRFEELAEERDFISVFLWDQQTINLKKTMEFEILDDPYLFHDWLGQGNVLETLKILSARILKGEESSETEEAIEALLRDFMTKTDISEKFVDLLSSYAHGSALNEWVTSTILFERYAHNRQKAELQREIRELRIKAAKRNPQAAPPSCILTNDGVFKISQNQTVGKIN